MCQIIRFAFFVPGALDPFCATMIIRCNEEDEEIRIGATIPLTAPAALYGQDTKRGAKLAV